MPEFNLYYFNRKDAKTQIRKENLNFASFRLCDSAFKIYTVFYHMLNNQ